MASVRHITQHLVTIVTTVCLLDSIEPCGPIPQLLEPVHLTHEIAIPARRYFRPISPALLSYYSLVYSE